MKDINGLITILGKASLLSPGLLVSVLQEGLVELLDPVLLLPNGLASHLGRHGKSPHGCCRLQVHALVQGSLDDVKVS